MTGTPEATRSLNKKKQRAYDADDVLLARRLGDELQQLVGVPVVLSDGRLRSACVPQLSSCSSLTQAPR
jgi:hypothetical protein